MNGNILFLISAKGGAGRRPPPNKPLQASARSAVLMVPPVPFARRLNAAFGCYAMLTSLNYRHCFFMSDLQNETKREACQIRAALKNLDYGIPESEILIHYDIDSKTLNKWREDFHGKHQHE